MTTGELLTFYRCGSVVGIFLLRFRVQCTNLYTSSYNFEFNLEFTCLSVFQKVSKQHEPLGQIQFELFEIQTSANKLQIEQEKLDTSLTQTITCILK